MSNGFSGWNNRDDKHSIARDAIRLIEKGMDQRKERQEQRRKQYLEDMEDSKPVMIGLAVFLVSLFGFFVWNPYLWILAFIFTFVAPSVGIFLIIRSKYAGDRKGQAISAEIEAMANDASFDVSEQIIVWDRLKFTKGIGTPLEGREEDIAEFHRRLVNVRTELSEAATSRHKVEAVLAADSVLASVRSLV